MFSNHPASITTTNGSELLTNTELRMMEFVLSNTTLIEIFRITPQTKYKLTFEKQSVTK
jgi:hypothetical protein